MSSNLRIIKICESCKQEFIARKTTTQTCSDPRAKRLYKLRERETAIGRTKLETEVKRKHKAFVTGEEVRAIQAKEWLTLKEAALLLECFVVDSEKVDVVWEGEVGEAGAEASV